jgi:membrane associated rhomboid family serine protease
MTESGESGASQGDIYRKKLLLSTVVPLVIVFFIWLVKIIELLFGLDLYGGGIRPLEARGLPGIFLSPFIHDDLSHIVNNTIPLFLLSTALFYFYSDSALNILGLTWVITGSLVWLAGRPAWHIGASGLVYGLASFLFFSGILRRHTRLMALSMLIVFAYGSMVWGIFPDITKYRNVSWEAHMLGFFSGIVLAITYRNEGPPLPVYEWMEEEEEEKGGGGEEEKGRGREGEKGRGGEGERERGMRHEG